MEEAHEFVGASLSSCRRGGVVGHARSGRAAAVDGRGGRVFHPEEAPRSVDTAVVRRDASRPRATTSLRSRGATKRQVCRRCKQLGNADEVLGFLELL